MQLTLADDIINDPYFNALFVQEGFGVILQARLVYVVGKEVQFDFYFEHIETSLTLEEQGLEEGPNGYTCRTSDASYNQSPEALIIEAVTVEGPLLTSLLHYESLDRLRIALSDLLEHIQKQLEEAAASSVSIIGPDEVERCRRSMGTADSLLAALCMEFEDRKDDPEFSRFFEARTTTDRPKLH